MEPSKVREIAQTEINKALWVFQTQLGVMIDNSNSIEAQVSLLATKVAVIKTLNILEDD